MPSKQKISPVVLKVVDNVADRRVGAVLEQPHLGALPRSGEVALQSRCARIEHAAIVVVVALFASVGGGGVEGGEFGYRPYHQHPPKQVPGIKNIQCLMGWVAL